MASSGGWLVFSFMLVLFALSFRTSSSLRCERGLGNCVDDELALSRHLKKRALRKNCRFSCIGRKRETDENKPIRNPENEKQTVDELIDEILLKSPPIKREKVESSRPPCQRFHCGGKKRSAEPPENEFGTANEVISMRERSRLAGCLLFGVCKRNTDKETFSSPKKLLENSEMKQPQEQEQQEQDSKPDCFRFGCKKRGLSGEEKPGLPVAPNEKNQEAIPAVDQDDTRKPRCWRFGCKRSNHFQTLVENISKRLNEKPNELQRFDPKKQERKIQ